METFNHLQHTGPSGDYSLIGNAHYWPLDAEVDATRLKAELIARAERVFGTTIDPSQAALYFGTKTEVINGQQRRNYQYQIVEGRNAVVVLPGKMSLAFWCWPTTAPCSRCAPPSAARAEAGGEPDLRVVGR